jgi:hypothetical protein
VKTLIEWSYGASEDRRGRFNANGKDARLKAAATNATSKAKEMAESGAVLG